MHLNRVDLNLFVFFDAIYTERNLTRVAEILHVTQPAVSNALKRLRVSFNDQLFVRTPEGMLPTPVADNVISRVRGALQLLGSSINEYDRFDPRKSDKTFNIAMGDLSEALFLPSLLKAMKGQAPSINLQSFALTRDDVALELANGGTDLAIEPPLISNSQLLSKPLITDNYVCVFRHGHPLTDKKLTLERYLALQHLHLSSRRTGIGQVDHALRAMGKQRQISMRAQHYLMAPFILENSDLALSIPATLAERLRLKAQPLPFNVPALQLHLFWHKNADNDPANQWLRSLLQDNKTSFN